MSKNDQSVPPINEEERNGPAAETNAAENTSPDTGIPGKTIPLPVINQDITSKTADMELHHPHPHHHHSRNWKDYFFEFLMLFLAITIGFFVENRREHYIENKRVKKFSQQLIADLCLDSLLFEQRKKDLLLKEKKHDSLFQVLTGSPVSSDKELLEALLPVTYVFDLPVTTSTYNQMKTSGSLRYIENPRLTTSLQNYYDVLLPRCNILISASLDFFGKYITPYYIHHTRIQDYDPFNDTLVNKNPLMIDRSSKTDQELANIMGNFRSLLTIQAITMNEPALNKIKEIMALLKEEYDL